MTGLQAISAWHMAKDRVSVLLRDVLIGAKRLAPSEARERVELLIELGMMLYRRAGERREVSRRHVGDTIVGPSVGGAEVTVGKAEHPPKRIHLIGESRFGPGNAFGEYDRGIITGQSDDTLEQVFDADLLARRQEHC